MEAARDQVACVCQACGSGSGFCCDSRDFTHSCSKNRNTNDSRLGCHCGESPAARPALGSPSWPLSFSSPQPSPAPLAHNPVTKSLSAFWDFRPSSLTSLSHRWGNGGCIIGGHPGGEQRAVEMCHPAHSVGATPPWSWTCDVKTTLLKSQGESLWTYGSTMRLCIEA